MVDWLASWESTSLWRPSRPSYKSIEKRLSGIVLRGLVGALVGSFFIFKTNKLNLLSFIVLSLNCLISVTEFDEIQRTCSGWKLVGGWLGLGGPGPAVLVVGALVGLTFQFLTEFI